MSAELARQLASIRNPRILVVGDYIQDMEIYCTAERFAQEAPHCPVWKFGDAHGRPGGAGAVAAMVTALGAEMIVICTIPALAATKTRYFIGDVQMLRVDHESVIPRPEESEKLAKEIDKASRHADCVLVADYGKGFCTPAILKAAIEGAKARGIPCIADPHYNPWYYYKGATCLKLNQQQAKKTANPLSCLVEFPIIVQTEGDEGILLCVRNHPDTSWEARPSKLVDVTGAGDMVLAVLGFCIAGGMQWSAACQVANVAAGLKCERRGAVGVPLAEIVAELESM